MGRWRIVEMPDYVEDHPDMVEPAYILFEADAGAFAFGCVTGQSSAGDRTYVTFSWQGNDETDEAQATDGLNSSLTEHSTAKSASTTAMKLHSALNESILQQPAKVRRDLSDSRDAL